MFKFNVDTKLPPLLTDFFRFKGYDATHTTNYPEAQYMSDKQIIEIDIKENRIIVSKDADFFDLFISEKENISVLFIHVGNIRNSD